MSRVHVEHTRAGSRCGETLLAEGEDVVVDEGGSVAAEEGGAGEDTVDAGEDVVDAGGEGAGEGGGSPGTIILLGCGTVGGSPLSGVDGCFLVDAACDGGGGCGCCGGGGGGAPSRIGVEELSLDHQRRTLRMQKSCARLVSSRCVFARSRERVLRCDNSRFAVSLPSCFDLGLVGTACHAGECT